MDHPIWYFDTSTCVVSDNVLCKHVRADKRYYFDFDGRLPADVTLVSATVETPDEQPAVGAVSVIAADTVFDDRCATVLYADRAVAVKLSAGIASDEEVLVTVTAIRSDGGVDVLAGRLLVDDTLGGR